MKYDRNIPKHLIFAAMLLAPFACVALVFHWANSMIDGRDFQISSRTEILSRLQTGIKMAHEANEPVSTATLAQWSTDFLVGNQDSVIVAELQNRLRALALANNVELNSSNILPPRPSGKLNYIGLRAIMRGQLHDIQKIMHAIEAPAPLLFVERLVIRVDTWPIKSADPTIDGAAAIIAEIDMFGAKQPESLAASALSTSVSEKPASLPSGGPQATAALPVPMPLVAQRGGRR